jgi:hypothetical protein
LHTQSPLHKTSLLSPNQSQIGELLSESLENNEPNNNTHLVACGFEQHEGIDFEETFVPMVKWNMM